MAGIKELRLRIKALKNTSKITAAMKMVSAAKLKKAQDAFARTKPYAVRMEEMFQRVLATLESVDHPLLKVRENKRTRYVVVSSDRGLAGAFNNGLFRAFTRTVMIPPSIPPEGGRASIAIEALGIGRRARDFLARVGAEKNGLTPVASELTNIPSYANAAAIAESVTRDYLDGKVDNVVLVYNNFRSVISQQPVLVPLLPITLPDVTAADASTSSASGTSAKGYKDIYFFEPDAETLFAELLPKLVALQVFRALLENAVGEHSARMTAMDNATKNTKELISSLTLTMNRARQAAITRELIEIVSGAETLKG